MTVGKVSAWLAVAGSIAGGAVWLVTTFESKAEAREARERILAETEAAVELAATDREIGDLRTRLELVEIKIRRLQDLADSRGLTRSEKIELESLLQERDVLLRRLEDVTEA